MTRDSVKHCYVKGHVIQPGERFRFVMADTVNGPPATYEREGRVEWIEDYPPAQVMIHLVGGTTVWRGDVLEAILLGD